MRRTFASVLYAIGEPPTVVMAEMGHTDPGLALRIYAAAMRRDEADSSRIQELVTGGELGTTPGLVPESVEIARNPTGSNVR